MLLAHDLQVQEYFRRLDAPLQKMPPDERAASSLELRQHLAELIAAYEELGCTPDEAAQLALRRFGDPGRVGRRLLREWQAARPAPYDADAVALACALAWSVGLTVALVMNPWARSMESVNVTVRIAVPCLAGLFTGWTLPRHGTRAMCLAALVFALPLLLLAAQLAVSGSAADASGILRLAADPLFLWPTLGGCTACLAGRLRSVRLPKMGRATPA